MPGANKDEGKEHAAGGSVTKVAGGVLVVYVSTGAAGDDWRNFKQALPRDTRKGRTSRMCTHTA